MARKSKKNDEEQKSIPLEEVENTESENTNEEDFDSEELTEEEKAEYEKLKQELLNSLEQQEEESQDDADYNDSQLDEEEIEQENVNENTDSLNQEDIDNENQDYSNNYEEDEIKEDNNLKENGENIEEEFVNDDLQQEDHNEDSYSKHRFDSDEEEDFIVENINETNDVSSLQPSELSDKQKEISPEIDQGKSKVALSKESSMAMMVGAGAVLIFVIYKILQPSPDELSTQTISEINRNLPIAKPIKDAGQTIVVPEIPKIPDVPVLAAPTPPPVPTPPAPPVLDINIPTPPPPPVSGSSKGDDTPTVNNSNPLIGFASLNADAQRQAEEQAKARKLAKQNSSMLMGGAGGGGGPRNINQEGRSIDILTRNTNQIAATFMGDLRRIIAQGKVIDAVLETAINTDLPGSLRAVVSRDVFAESGKNILIPKGSRLIGSYATSVAYGVSRVQIIWSRLIRPDGIDVQINSTSVDNLGRAGVPGELNEHIMKNLSTALMISMLDYGLATYLDKNTTSGTTTVTYGASATGTSSTNGVTITPTTTTSTTPSNQQLAANNMLANVQEVGKQILEKSMARPPTITINQGTSLKVYVQRDIIFPGRSANLTKVIE